MDLGLDSLDAPKFVQNLNSALGLELQNTVIFEEPCVRDLSEKILKTLQARGPPPPKAQAQTHWEKAGCKMAPPSDDDFYLRSSIIPYYQMKEVATKMRGIPEEYVGWWSAQRQAKAVITQEMMEETRRFGETECF